jgi:hypothetical protein
VSLEVYRVNIFKDCSRVSTLLFKDPISPTMMLPTSLFLYVHGSFVLDLYVV